MTEKSGWVAGYNMVGYLPEMEPYATDDWLSAVEFLLNEMDRHADAEMEHDDQIMLELAECIADLKASTDTDYEVTYVVGNEAYWVQPCYVVATEDGFDVVDAEQPEFPDMPGWSNAAKIARIDYLIGMKDYHRREIEVIVDEIHELRLSMIDD